MCGHTCMCGAFVATWWPKCACGDEASREPYRTHMEHLDEGLPATADICEPPVWFDGDQEARIRSIMLSLLQAVPCIPHKS